MPTPSNSNTGGHAWEAPTPEALSAQLTGYDVTRLLGCGGMGAVYEGHQKNLDRRIAIKLLPRELHRSESGAEMDYEERFRLEARSMAALSHSAIVSVFDFGQTAENDFYFVMEFVDGTDVHQFLHANGGKLSSKDAIGIATHVLDGLQYAHKNGLLHRDIKPANILLDREGRVKIADFGLAKKTGPQDPDTPALTLDDVSFGTPDYAAPELTRSGVTPDHRADLYAVGVMLYQMLTGEIPRGAWHPPSKVVPGTDPRLDRAVEKAMDSNPQDRFQDAESFRAELERIATTPVPAVLGTGPVRAVRFNTGAAADALTGPVKVKAVPGAESEIAMAERARKPMAFWLGVVGAPVLLIIVALLFVRGGKDESVPESTAHSGAAGADSSPDPTADYFGPDSGANYVEPDGFAKAKPNEKKSDSKDRDKNASHSDKSESTSENALTEASNQPDAYQDLIASGKGTWQPMQDMAALRKSAGDAILFPLNEKHGGIRFDPPEPHVLIRWRGFRALTIGIEGKSPAGDDMRRSYHTSSAGGFEPFTAPPSRNTPAGAYDAQLYVLITGRDAYRWRRNADKNTARDKVEERNADTIAWLRQVTGGVHDLPYRYPAHSRSCDILIPTEEQLAGLMAADTYQDIAALPWTAFDEDKSFRQFQDDFDRICEVFASGDMESAFPAAGELLDRQPISPLNPYRRALVSIRECAQAILALNAAAATADQPNPELPDNGQYRFDAETGHAFVMVPLYRSHALAQAFAAQCGGHLATTDGPQSSQGKILHEWLAEAEERPPLPIVFDFNSRRGNHYHLGAERSGDNWQWHTGEPFATDDDAAWRDGQPGSRSTGRSQLAYWWKADRDAAKIRIPSLGWAALSSNDQALMILEFPARATRYPAPSHNHPSARDAAPGSTGDALLDFEGRFTHQWREKVEQPTAELDAKLRNKYSTALEQRARTIAQKGQLDAVLPWHYEIETIRSGSPPQPFGDSAPTPLVNLRKIWDTEAVKIGQRRQTLIDATVAEATAELEAIEKELVRKQLIERAAVVQKRRKQLSAGEGLPGSQ